MPRARTDRRSESAASASASTTAGWDAARRLELYRHLLAARGIDERLTRSSEQGLMPGEFRSQRGSEAVGVGAAAGLRDGDLIAGGAGAGLRGGNLNAGSDAAGLTGGDLIAGGAGAAGALLVRGFTPREIFAQNLGRAMSPTQGRDLGSAVGDLATRGVVAGIGIAGETVCVMAGCALGFVMRGEQAVALTWIDAAEAATGAFHEALSFAAVRRLPLIVVIVVGVDASGAGNGGAGSSEIRNTGSSASDVSNAERSGNVTGGTGNARRGASDTGNPRSGAGVARHTGSAGSGARDTGSAGIGAGGSRDLDLSKCGVAYGCALEEIDGADLIEVGAAVASGADRARSGGGPTVILARLDRSEAADDPIERYEQHLIEDEVATRAECDAIAAETGAALDDALAWAEEAGEPDPASLTSGVYAGPNADPT